MKSIIKTIKIILLFSILGLIITTLLFGHSDIPLDELKAKYTQPASLFVEIEGMDVHYVDEGNQNDTLPIVLIHGTGSNLQTFDGWANSLKTTRRVIRMDIPAYGLTGPFPNRDYSIAHYTKFITKFLNAINVKQCVLGGNSLGGQIAWNVALKQPDMVTKLILIDAAGYHIDSKNIPIAFILASIPVIDKLFTYITPRFIARLSLESVYFNKSKVTDVLVDRYFELTLRAGNRQAFVDRLNTAPDTISYKSLNKIQQPTLLLWGKDDLLIPIDHAIKFQKNIPNNTLVILEKLGHTPMEESPIESLNPVLYFLKQP